MSRFTRTAGIVTALALTLSTFSVTSASAMYRGMGHEGGMMRQGGMMNHDGGMMHHGGGFGRSMAIGAGVGIGLMLLNAAVEAEQNRQIENQMSNDIPRLPKAPKAPKKPEVAKHDVKKDTPRKDEPKIVKNDDTLETPPIREEHPVFVTPTFPDVVKVNCGDANCNKLWESIEHYKAIIAEDTTKLQIRQADANNRHRQAKAYEDQAAKAKTAADRTYFQRMSQIEGNSANQLDADNVTLQGIINQEQAILADRIAQYNDCVKKICSPQNSAALPPR